MLAKKCQEQRDRRAKEKKIDTGLKKGDQVSWILLNS
jgi:hypothetical protein